MHDLQHNLVFYILTHVNQKYYDLLYLPLEIHFIQPLMFLILPKFVTSQTQQNKFVNWQGDAEIRGEDFTATVTLGNPDVLVGSGRSSVSDVTYIQSVDMFTFCHPETKITFFFFFFYP